MMDWNLGSFSQVVLCPNDSAMKLETLLGACRMWVNGLGKKSQTDKTVWDLLLARAWTPMVHHQAGAQHHMQKDGKVTGCWHLQQGEAFWIEEWVAKQGYSGLAVPASLSLAVISTKSWVFIGFRDEVTRQHTLCGPVPLWNVCGKDLRGLIEMETGN